MKYRQSIALLMATSVAACSVGVDVNHTQPVVAPGWHATLPHGGSTVELTNWWGSLGDKRLTQLMALAEANSPTVGSAVASIRAARATVRSNQSSLLPSLTASETLSRKLGQSATASFPGGSTISNIASGQFDSSWEIDLFGKARSNVNAAKYRLAGAQASWNDARVTLAAEVADDYVQYRGCMLTEDVYRRSLNSQNETLKATGDLVNAGLASSNDLLLARGNAATASITLTAQIATCEAFIKTLTQLSGGDESETRKILGDGIRMLPRPRTFAIKSLPADLLRQRPDIVASEAEMAARMADAGASAADIYPSLSLSGSLSITNGVTGWSFGPALSLPFFQGGAKRAALEYSKAQYQKQAESYRGTVLSAVAEVETNLVKLRAARLESSDAARAADNLRQYFNAVDENWKAGGISLLDRETARRNSQSADLTLISIRMDVLRQWIALFKSLGGGWSTTPGNSEPQTKTTGALP